MVKNIILLVILVASISVALPAQASFCRHLNDHLICIVSIKRSAKYHWEYRAVLSVDGVERPLEIYNCRDRVRARKDGTVVAFEPNGAGELICNILKR